MFTLLNVFILNYLFEDAIIFMSLLILCMDKISFKANLKINKNLYKNLPLGTKAEFPEKLINEFSEFLNHPKIKKATEGDTIELSRGKNSNGFAIEMNFSSPELANDFKTGIYTNKKVPDIKPQELKYWTYLYLCHKQGEQPRLFESSFQMIERVLFDGKKVFNRNK